MLAIFLRHLRSADAPLSNGPGTGVRARLPKPVFRLHEKRNTTRFPAVFTQKRGLSGNAARVLQYLFGQRRHVRFTAAPAI